MLNLPSAEFTIVSFKPDSPSLATSFVDDIKDFAVYGRQTNMLCGCGHCVTVAVCPRTGVLRRLKTCEEDQENSGFQVVLRRHNAL